MNRIILTFIGFVIYPLTVQADFEPVIDVPDNNSIETALFDELPIKQTEVNKVTRLFWNAQSIQDKVKTSIPSQHRARFTPNDGCDVKSVVKTEASAEVCELNDDPNKMGKFTYNLSVSCKFGTYQIDICSREESKLLNQIKVKNPEVLVSDENPFDLESTM